MILKRSILKYQVLKFPAMYSGPRSGPIIIIWIILPGIYLPTAMRHEFEGLQTYKSFRRAFKKENLKK